MVIRKEWGIAARAPVIGIVARFQAQRGHRFLLEAAGALKKQIAGLKVLLVGKGEFRPRLEQMVRDLNLQETVIFTGYRDDLPEMYTLFDVNVFLREGNDGSCRALLEAMAAGKLVMAFEVGAIPESVRQGMTGYLVPPDEVKALTDSLSLVLSHTDRVRNLTGFSLFEHPAPSGHACKSSLWRPPYVPTVPVQTGYRFHPSAPFSFSIRIFSC